MHRTTTILGLTVIGTLWAGIAVGQIDDVARVDEVDGDPGGQPIRPGSVHGHKWSDRNGNAERDPDEPGLPGVTIFSDRNNNGQLEDDEPRAVTMRDNPDTDFDESGLYWLEVRPGRHVVREVVPDGFVQTFPPLILPVVEDGVDEFAHVSPPAIHLTLAAGEVAVQDVTLTIRPLCIRPFKVGVAAPGAPLGIVENLTGDQLNGCGGDTSKFEILFTGDGASRGFDLQFVDAEFGGTLGVIPVRINRPDASGAHIVVVRPGQAVGGVDFGNRRVASPNQIPGDCNQNGECEFSDAICLLRVLFSRDRTPKLPCGDGTIDHPSNVLLLDFNGDRVINLGDVIAKLFFILLQDHVDHILGPRCVFIPECDDVCR